jgi:hypothetical protein
VFLNTPTNLEGCPEGSMVRTLITPRHASNFTGLSIIALVIPYKTKKQYLSSGTYIFQITITTHFST